MKRITERDNILGVAEQWDAQYSINIKGLTTHATEEQLAISKRLHAMNLKRVKASTVDKVIGNNSWTKVECEVCKNRVPAVVVVYSEDEAAIEICESCLNLAKRVIQGKAQ
jgi:hypothetical protein